MQEQYLAIGETAGKIYKALEKGDKTTEDLAKEIQVNDPALLHQAIGWLAREGKIRFELNYRPNRLSLIGAGVISC